MTRKNENSSILGSLPIDERPILIIVKGKVNTTYCGRFIKQENLFMLSLNDRCSDFVYSDEVEEWWYVNEHPTIIKEVIAK